MIFQTKNSARLDKLEVEIELVLASISTLQLTLLETIIPRKPAQEKRTARKTPLHKKKCEVCGKAFKGNVGLGIHRAKIHGE